MKKETKIYRKKDKIKEQRNDNGTQNEIKGERQKKQRTNEKHSENIHIQKEQRTTVGIQTK